MAYPIIQVFKVDKSTIDKGDKVVFQWLVYFSDSQTLTVKGSIPPSGSWTVYPSTTRTYTLTAVSGLFTVNKSLTITVIQPPPTPPPPTPPPAEKYTLLIHTIPIKCYVDVEGHASMWSDANGLAPFYNVLEGPKHITVLKEGFDTATYDIVLESDMEITIDITGAPDFWEDPIGWIQYFVISVIDDLLNWLGGSFVTLLYDVKNFMDTSWTQIADFLNDPVTAITNWMTGVFITLQELGSQISTSITDWWTQTVIDVGVMITNATTGFSSWINESFSNIGAWWESIKTVWGTWLDDRIKGVEDWVNEFSANVSNWYNSNVQPIIDAISSGIDDAANWIKGFPTLIAQWWDDRVIEVGVWITDATTAANDWITGFPTLIGDWWNDRVVEIGVWLTDRNNEIKTWVDEGLPGWIDDMFDWAKPVVQPIKDAVGLLGTLVGIATGTEPEDPRMIEWKIEQKRLMDEAEEIAGR